jgi:1-acyl-sn-glycerol-3-phosphate acyltransferase
MPTTAMRVAHAVAAPPLLRRLRAQVTGRDRVPMTGGVLLAANHRSFLDHYLMSAACPRPMWYLGKAELGTGIYGFLNTRLGMIPVDRGRADLEAIQRIVGLLRDGDVVGVFPEGTRSPDGMMYRFRSGMARIAAQAQVPVVPVGLIGTAQVWPPRTLPSLRRPPAGALRVHFGELRPAPADNGAARRAFTHDLQDVVAELCGQPRTDSFAAIPAQQKAAEGQREKA